MYVDQLKRKELSSKRFANMPVDRKGFVELDVMELSRKEFEKQLSCELARTICMYMVRHRAALSMDFVSASCRYVATLCNRNQDCGTAPGTCAKAADALEQKNEKAYLELCARAYSGCSLSKKVREEWKKAAEKAGLLRERKPPELYR